MFKEIQTEYCLPLSFIGGVTYDALRLTGELEAYRSADKTEPSLNLRKVAFERGFVISDNQGEGNCMFLAISEQLKLIKGMKFSDKELRKNVVRYLKDNPRLVSSIQMLSYLLCTYQCKASGGQGMGWGFDCLCCPWGRAFD